MRRTCQIYFTNIVELVIAILIGALLASTICINCFRNLHGDQFVNGVVYGFIIILILIVINISIGCDPSRIWSLIVAVLGAVLYFAAGIVLLVFVSGFPSYASQSIYLRLLVGGLFCFVLSAVFVFNVILLLKSDDCSCICDECCE